jgi:hypothetical protein
MSDPKKPIATASTKAISGAREIAPAAQALSLPAFYEKNAPAPAEVFMAHPAGEAIFLS